MNSTRLVAPSSCIADRQRSTPWLNASAPASAVTIASLDDIGCISTPMAPFTSGPKLASLVRAPPNVMALLGSGCTTIRKAVPSSLAPPSRRTASRSSLGVSPRSARAALPSRFSTRSLLTFRFAARLPRRVGLSLSRPSSAGLERDLARLYLQFGPSHPSHKQPCRQSQFLRYFRQGRSFPLPLSPILRYVSLELCIIAPLPRRHLRRCLNSSLQLFSS
jgi:hypothetical protein